MRDSGTEKNMSKVLEAMKVSLTNAMELRAVSKPTDVLNAYYRGKIFGVLEVAGSGILSRREHEEFLKYYESEKARVFFYVTEKARFN